LIENIIFIGVLVTVTSVAWSLVYNDRSNSHFNLVIFPLAALNSDSPFTPLVSEGFWTWYGGYYLWLGLLSRLKSTMIGNCQFCKEQLQVDAILSLTVYFIFNSNFELNI
jgi:hypothetical protein